MWARSVVRDGSITSSDHNAFLAASMLHDESNLAPAFSTAAGGIGGVSGGGGGGMALPESTPAGWVSRNGSRAPSAQQDLETVHNLESEIVALGLQVLATEREVEEVQEAFSIGGAYRGRTGEALATVEERLVRKEQQLREKEKLLREEKVVLLRSRSVGSVGGPPHRVASAEAVPQKRVSFVMTSTFVDDPDGEVAEQRRLSQVNEVIKRRRSVSGHCRPDAAGSTDAVITVHKMEEDSRLLARLGAFELPILVSTLLAGFTLVMFDVASTDMAKRLAVIAFGLESSASIVLSLVTFRGQQLYSNSTDINPLTRKFLRRMCPVTIVALLAFALGVVAFVVAFVLEASEELGSSWIAVVALVFCPTLIAGGLYALSTVQVRGSSVGTAAGPGLE